jgi:diguanylate cyclase (GGDEF)-like protein/PAS domain S-box-containing protein
MLGAAALILGSIIGWNVYSEHTRIDAEERAQLLTQANVLEQNLGRQLLATNLALDSVRNDLPFLKKQQDGKALVNLRLQAMSDAMLGVRTFLLLDAEGTGLASNREQLIGQNFGEREYFRVARQGGDPARLYVSPPIQTVLGIYALNVAKVVLDDRGQFAGLILATLAPDYFNTLLSSVIYSPDMRSSLIHADGKMVFRVPDPQGIVGIDLAARPGAFFIEHMKSGQPTSVFAGVVATSGESRLSVFRTVQPAAVQMDKPLVVVVSREMQALFAPWRKQAYASGGLFGVLMLTAALSLVFYQRRQRDYERLVADQEAERKLAEADLRVAAAVFESQEGMIVTDAGSVILRVNRAFTEITGYTAEEVVGQTPRLLKSGRHDADFYRLMWETINRTGVWQGEIWDRRKDGEVYPKWLTISAVKGDDGAVTHYIGTQFDISERKKAENKIEQLAFFDQLTGLPNRTLLLDRLKQAMAACSRSGSHGALLFIDLDKFKTLNDTLGHDAGDMLLKQVAQRLTLCVRESDTVGRLGGDEFVVVLAGFSKSLADSAAAAETVAEKILASLNQTYALGDAAHCSTASIGVTLFGGDRASIDDLMKQADLAMYQSKAAGRNTIRFFDPALEASVKERVALEEDLRRAVAENQFLLHYQAQVAGEGCVTGAEVLVRWQHPRRGMVSPAEFIPLAEETGMILPLGHWVLETACTQLARWAVLPGMAHLTLAVNVSAHQFRQADFVDEVLAILKKTDANPQRLKLELTESMLVHNVEEIIEKMLALRVKGVGFSLDDFGTGYSSLSYLKRLPLDQLKIDQSFVRDVLVDPNDAAIARTIVALGENLGLAVIAEGVETEAQRDFLANSGCHAYQGYFFSRPLSIDGFEAFAQSRTGFLPEMI